MTDDVTIMTETTGCFSLQKFDLSSFFIFVSALIVVIFFEHAVERKGPELYTFTTTMALVRVRIGQKKGKLIMKEKTEWQGI